MPIPTPRKIPAPPKLKPNLPAGNDLNTIFGTKKPRQAPSLTGQGNVDVDTIQMVMEAIRSNPNGVRVQYLNLSEPQKMQIAMKMAEKFPPSRPGEFMSPQGQEIFDFLQDGSGVAGSPERMKVLADDFIASMADGPVTLNRQPAANIDPDSGVRDGVDMSTELGPADEGGIIDNTKPENPQNPDAAARDNAATAGVFKSKQQTAPAMRGPEMDQQVLPNGQPVATPIPGTTVPSRSIKGMQAPFVTSPEGKPVPTWENGSKFAEGAIQKNISPDQPVGSKGVTADQVASGDSKTYRGSFNEIINGMLNNSATPNSVSGNRMESLMGLLSKNPNANPKLQFASIDDFVDAIAGNVDVAALNNSKNPSRIGESLAPSQKAQINLDEVKDLLRRQAIQKYGGSGWGAESAADLSKPAPEMTTGSEVNDLGNLDGVGDIELAPVTPDNANLFNDTPVDTVRPQKRGGDMKYIKDENGRIIDTDGEYGPLRERAKDDFTRDTKISNTESDAKVKQEAADDLVDEMLANGADPDAIEAALIEQGLDQESIEALKQDQLSRIDRYGLEPHQGGKATGAGKAGSSPLGGKGRLGPKPPPPVSVKGAQEKKIGAKGPKPPPPTNPDGTPKKVKGGKDFVKDQNKGTPTPAQQAAIDAAVKDAGGDLDGTSDSKPIDNNDSASTEIPTDDTQESIDINKQANGPIPPQNTGKKPSDGELGASGSKADAPAADTKPATEGTKAESADTKPATDPEQTAAGNWKETRKQTKKDLKKKKKPKKDTGGKTTEDSTLWKNTKRVGKAAVLGGGLIGLLALLNKKGGKHVGDANGLRNGRGEGDGEVGVTDEANGLNPNVDDGKKGRLTDAERGDILRRLRSSRGVNKNTQTNKRWTR